MEEQPVALATIMRSPNSWVTSFTYGVSPQPAQAPENSKSGFLSWASLMVLGCASPLNSGSVWAYSQFFSSAVWVARGFMTSALFFAGQTCAQFSQPVQSSGETCMRKVRPLNFGPSAGLVAKVSGALALPSSSTI